MVEFRYVGNHGVGLWRTINLNEVNIYENGFLNQFQMAQNNLAIARARTPTLKQFRQSGLSRTAEHSNYFDRSRNDQRPDDRYISVQGQPGAAANAIATNATRMANLTKAGYPVNLFQVNPIIAATPTS